MRQFSQFSVDYIILKIEKQTQCNYTSFLCSWSCWEAANIKMSLHGQKSQWVGTVSGISDESDDFVLIYIIIEKGPWLAQEVLKVCICLSAKGYSLIMHLYNKGLRNMASDCSSLLSSQSDGKQTGTSSRDEPMETTVDTAGTPWSGSESNCGTKCLKRFSRTDGFQQAAKTFLFGFNNLTMRGNKTLSMLA